jgi:hypothetical protein
MFNVKAVVYKSYFFLNNYMYVYHLFVLPIVLEDEVCMFISRSSYVNHICLTHRAMECVLENGEMTGPAVLKYRLIV